MSDIAAAIKQICDEKGLSYEAVLETIESALAAAYRKDYGEKNQNINVEFNPETGKSKIFDIKIVVEDMPEEDPLTGSGPDEEGKEGPKEKEKKKPEDKKDSSQSKDGKETKEKKDDNKDDNNETKEERRFNPKTEIQLTEAKLTKKTAKVGNEIKTKLEMPAAFGRMAAQTAKQVIIQKLREAEREMIFNEFREKEHEVVSGIVQRQESRLVLVDLGKAVGVLPLEEQIANEKYISGNRIKVYIREVRMASKGPEIILSRTSEEILKKIFYLEIPEISNGLIEIKAIVREAGNRSKIAVQAINENVDPIGSCVGQRGARIQTIINELGGEKVDIIEYDEDPAKFIINALSPAKVLNIKIDEKKKEAQGMVSNDQLSLAIGKGGQNVRLAARLTGWRIDIVGEGSGQAETNQEKDKSDSPEVKIEEGKDGGKDDNKKEEVRPGKVKEEARGGKKPIEKSKIEESKKTEDKKEEKKSKKFESSKDSKKDKDKDKKKKDKKEEKKSEKSEEKSNK